MASQVETLPSIATSTCLVHNSGVSTGSRHRLGPPLRRANRLTLTWCIADMMSARRPQIVLVLGGVIPGSISEIFHSKPGHLHSVVYDVQAWAGRVAPLYTFSG